MIVIRNNCLTCRLTRGSWTMANGERIALWLYLTKVVQLQQHGDADLGLAVRAAAGPHLGVLHLLLQPPQHLVLEEVPQVARWQNKQSWFPSLDHPYSLQTSGRCPGLARPPAPPPWSPGPWSPQAHATHSCPAPRVRALWPPRVKLRCQSECSGELTSRIYFQVILAPLDNDLSNMKSKKFLFAQKNIHTRLPALFSYSICPHRRHKQVTDGCKTFQTWLVYKIFQQASFWLAGNKIPDLLSVAEYKAGISRNSNPIIVKVSINIYSDRDGLSTLSRSHGHPPPYNILPLGKHLGHD